MTPLEKVARAMFAEDHKQTNRGIAAPFDEQPTVIRNAYVARSLVAIDALADAFEGDALIMPEMSLSTTDGRPIPNFERTRLLEISAAIRSAKGE